MAGQKETIENADGLQRVLDGYSKKTGRIQMSPRQHPNLTLSAITVFTGMGLVFLTHLVRPLPKTASPLAVLVAGSLPNFGAGLGLPFVGAAIPRILGRARAGAGWFPFGLDCVGAFTALVLWEYVQLALWRIPVDPNDLAASGLGVVLAALLRLAGRSFAGTAIRAIAAKAFPRPAIEPEDESPG